MLENFLALLTLKAGWARPGRAPAAFVEAPSVTSPSMQATQLREDEQIARLAGVTLGAVARTEAVAEMQIAAARQLDAAAYALSRVTAELGSVMALPKPERVASVHKLEPLLRPERSDVWRKVISSQAA